MPSKKTGLFLNSISEPIVNEVMQKYGYTKISNCINFIIQEYDRMMKEHVAIVPDVNIMATDKPLEQIKKDLSGWFVSEDKNA